MLDWLRQVREGHVQPIIWGSDDERLLVFTEPNVAFSLADRAEDSVTIRAHLSLESGPPERGELFDYFVPLELTRKAIDDAIVEWETALKDFPIR